MPDSRSLEAASPARRPIGQPVALLLGAAAVLFAACSVVYLLPFDGFLEAAVRSTRNNGMTALDPVFYGVAGIAAFVLLLVVLRLFDMLLKRFNKPDAMAGSPEKSIEQFAGEATVAQISVRVAREGYQLLRHYYSDRMCVDLHHDLRDDLKLTDEDILQLHVGLLNRTERREMRDLAATSMVTVRDLLEYVENAPAQHLDGVAVRVRSTDVPSAERGVAIKVESSGLFLRDQISGEHRRASDYIGPRRRASDSKVKRAYSGPHRRASDRLPTPLAGKSAERPNELTASELNQNDPHFVPPRKRVTP